MNTEERHSCLIIGEMFNLPKGYVLKDENGNLINAQKIVLEKKDNGYPKTYDECCKELNIAVRDLDILDNMLDTTEIVYRKNLDRLLNSFRKLLICRDAYWKIAGEEFNWDNALYYIYTNDDGNVIESDDLDGHNYVLAFPNKASRDAFKENFDKDLETCKELL